MTLLFVVAVGVACGSRVYDDDGLLAPFGSNDTVCASANLTNDETDEAILRAAIDCLLTEVGAERSIVLDVDQPTVEGDSTYYRYSFDGESILIVSDNRLDEFGPGAVRAKRCQTLERDRWLPIGVDCVSTSHPGFPEADG